MIIFLPVYHRKDWFWSWSSNTLATWCEELTRWKRPWWWERLRGRGEGWDGWMALPTRWTWVWANSRREWRMGKPGVLQATGVTKSQTWLKDWTTKLISYQSFFLCEYSVYTLSQLLPIEQWITFLCSYELFPYLGNLASVIFVTKPFVGADCF